MEEDVLEIEAIKKLSNFYSHERQTSFSEPLQRRGANNGKGLKNIAQA
jgi:hypothetical protein